VLARLQKMQDENRKTNKTKDSKRQKTPGAGAYMLERARTRFTGWSDEPCSGLVAWPRLTRKPTPGAPPTRGLYSRPLPRWRPAPNRFRWRGEHACSRLRRPG
jgi:hypothetical protein